jgi:hypothetical protein
MELYTKIKEFVFNNKWTLFRAISFLGAIFFQQTFTHQIFLAPYTTEEDLWGHFVTFQIISGVCITVLTWQFKTNQALFRKYSFSQTVLFLLKKSLSLYGLLARGLKLIFFLCSIYEQPTLLGIPVSTFIWTKGLQNPNFLFSEITFLLSTFCFVFERIWRLALLSTTRDNAIVSNLTYDRISLRIRFLLFKFDFISTENNNIIFILSSIFGYIFAGFIFEKNHFENVGRAPNRSQPPIAQRINFNLFSLRPVGLLLNSNFLMVTMFQTILFKLLANMTPAIKSVRPNRYFFSQTLFFGFFGYILPNIFSQPHASRKEITFIIVKALPVFGGVLSLRQLYFGVVKGVPIEFLIFNIFIYFFRRYSDSALTRFFNEKYIKKALIMSCITLLVFLISQAYILPIINEFIDQGSLWKPIRATLLLQGILRSIQLLYFIKN